MLFQKAKLYITHPTQAFQNEVNTSLGDAAIFILVFGLIYSVLSGIVSLYWSNVALSLLGLGSSPMMAFLLPFSIVSSYIVLVIGSFVCGAIFHIFPYMFGARQGIRQTIKTVIYASTPTLLLGWIPFVGLITFFWTIYLGVVGLKTLQQMTTGKAFTAIILPLAILFIIIIFAVIYALGIFMPATYGLPTIIQ